jgi:hypothetical protein
MLSEQERQKVVETAVRQLQEQGQTPVPYLPGETTAEWLARQSHQTLRLKLEEEMGVVDRPQPYLGGPTLREQQALATLALDGLEAQKRERLRDQFAAAALTGILASQQDAYDYEDICANAWGIADAMLRQRDR